MPAPALRKLINLREETRDIVQHLNLFRMHAMPFGHLRNRRILPQRLQRDLRLERRINPVAWAPARSKFREKMSALRRIALAATRLADATCGTICLKLLKIGALVTISVRRILFSMASAFPYVDPEKGSALLRLRIGVMNFAPRRVSMICCVGCPESSSSQCRRGHS